MSDITELPPPYCPIEYQQPIMVCGECGSKFWLVDTSLMFTCANCEAEYSWEDMLES